ncbi:MAG TPA: type II toxin-antitoxin system RelE/ParE family toxin [Polyangiaceae bacterium]|nr:type II toxin-antitoxin system RelE/ParE family toxin [Polyangiaceae bacterium]
MKVILTPRAVKDLDRLAKVLDAAAFELLLQRLEGLAEGFEGLNVKKLQGAAGKMFRIRYGNLRVIVERRGRECHVLEVVDRKDAY